ncbi:rubisco accumulation factor 1.1, chloroplastic [Physcomitrium patens]|uniref:Uncharacterized protein n=1 Tax=Physcomitrium patens TaxID=3218 RepID=A0A2K1IZW7_PHYPA|nr:rubisco accumulation factor 1.1, chloroplastic-like [Physcomitrium patens]PNR34810.1 hypothetical protein PHYPA_022708 [Physcomitrium patens]|eukprot:XP_024402609.1 rubisco accumulation factor 1.1, chloroplastic-like [Physcomitrella patens]
MKMNMHTCHATTAGALASGSGMGVCRLGTCLGNLGWRDLSTTSFGERNLKLRVEIGKIQQISDRENARESRRLVCSAVGGGRDLYQPFRPPINIETPSGATTVTEQLEILRERRGLWYEYASLIPILVRSGYTPSMIEEETGMTGVEQNIIVVGSQVRNSLKANGFDEEMLRTFDLGGGELLYELRILSAQQRRTSAEFVIERKMSPKEACELARSVKDFERRKNSEGYKEFTSAPGDCLAFAFYRKSIECQDEAEIEKNLQKGLQFCVSDKAKAKFRDALKKLAGKAVSEELEEEGKTFLQVIRLLEGEAVGTNLPVMLPVADATLKSFEDVPSVRPQGEGPFNVFSINAWTSWVALPGWHPIVSAGAPVAVNFPDAAKLPLQSNKNGVPRLQEPTLIIVDKSDTEADDNQCLYVVAQKDSQELSISSAGNVLDSRVLGRVIFALRPPVPPSEEAVEWE